MADSDPSALDVVGQGLVRDLRTKLDATYFSDTVANDPDGIESLANVQTTTGSFDGSLDVFAEAVSLAENVGVLAVNPVDGLPNMALVGNPADVLAVSTTKVAVDANQLLLGSDSTQATARCVLGVPLYSSPAVTAGDMWLIPRDKVFVVLRTDPRWSQHVRLLQLRSHGHPLRAASRLRLPARAGHRQGRYRQRQLAIWMLLQHLLSALGQHIAAPLRAIE